MAIQAQLYSDNIGFPLCGSQDWIDNNNGCGIGSGGFNQLCFSLQQKQQQQLQHLQQQQQLQQIQNQQQPRNHQSLCIDNSLVPSSLNNNNNNNNCESMMYSQTMISQVDKQRHEIDQFIRSQNERLRLLLQQQRKQQVAALLKKIESKACILLRQKDEEIAKATNKTMELQNLLKKLEMENQAWQKVAQENEAMVVSLNNTLEQLREQASCCFNNEVDDAESYCEVDRKEEVGGIGTEKNRGFPGLTVDNHQGQETAEERTRRMTMTQMTMACKCCNSRSSSVLFLPCRHLCSCKDCAAFLDSCPVCKTAKKASIEALIS